MLFAKSNCSLSNFYNSTSDYFGKILKLTMKTHIKMHNSICFTSLLFGSKTMVPKSMLQRLPLWNSTIFDIK